MDPSHQPPRLSPGEGYRLVYDRTDRALLEMQKHNPMRVAEICSALEGQKLTSRPVSNVRLVEVQQYDAPIYSDPFGKLPVELLQSIVSELSSPEVVALKRSSRIFYCLPLPDTFWRSRFLPGREFEYVLEAFNFFETRNGQWKAIYQDLRNVRKSLGLVNKQRVWNLARTLDDLLETRLENPICLGTKVCSYFELAAAEEKDAAWIGGYRCLRPFNQAFSTGCRQLYVRTMLVPLYAVDIYVSVVNILDKTYVSGLRFAKSRGSMQQIGYIRPEKEIPLIWNTQTEAPQVIGFHLARDQHGVRGLCAVSEVNKLTGWAGQHDGIPKRRLALPAGNQDDTVGIAKLKAGFDVSHARTMILVYNGCSWFSSTGSDNGVTFSILSQWHSNNTISLNGTIAPRHGIMVPGYPRAAPVIFRYYNEGPPD